MTIGWPVRASGRPVELGRRCVAAWPVARITARLMPRMRRRDAGRGQPAKAGGHARQHAERHAGGGQRQRLLAAAPEDEGIAALEPQHPLARAREFDQPLR